MMKVLGVGIFTLLTILFGLALAQNKPTDLTGTCDAMGGSGCIIAGKEVLRFVMVGMTGTGKSATGNMIVGLARKARDMLYAVWNGEKPFYSRTSSESVTVKGKREDITLYGREIAIVDTPGFFDTRFKDETTIKEILQCTYLIAPGPHAILLVARADRLTNEVLNALELMKKVFGEELVKHLIVVFTYGDNLKRDGESIDEFVSRLKGPYKDLLRQADNRYVLFDNTLDPSSPDNEEQVRQLFEMTDRITEKNNGQCYRNDLLEASYKLMQEEERKHAENIKKEKEKQMELERKAKENDIFKAELKALELKIQNLEKENQNLEDRARRLAESAAAAQQRQDVQIRSGGKCFASTSTVYVQCSNGLVIKKNLSDLEVGDLVESYDPETESVIFSPVYHMIYKDDNETVSVLRRMFYEDTDGKEKYLAIHPKHMVYANALAYPTAINSQNQDDNLPSFPIMSEDVKVGDILWIKDTFGHLIPKPVTKLGQMTSHVRHPLTFSHYIIVDGVLASVHTHNEWILRQVTAPLRLLYTVSPSLNDAQLTKKMVQSWDLVENYILE